MSDDNGLPETDLAQVPNPFTDRVAQPEKLETQKTLIPVGPRGVELHSREAMFSFAKTYMDSGLLPLSIKKLEQAVIIWMKAAELGITPMLAIEKMAVVNNKVHLMTELCLAMVEQRGLLKDTPKEEYNGEGDDFTCTVTVHRKGRKSPGSASFSIRDAKIAQLYREGGAWTKYPRNMLYARAMGTALHRIFPDVMCGMYTVEEMPDALPITNGGE